MKSPPIMTRDQRTQAVMTINGDHAPMTGWAAISCAGSVSNWEKIDGMGFYTASSQSFRSARRASSMLQATS